MRETDAALIGRNRFMACGDAPSIQGISCDEYPFASPKNGLASGGNRRTFGDCGLPSILSGTGPTGISVCMLTKAHQDYRGGVNTQFYRGRTRDRERPVPCRLHGVNFWVRMSQMT
ncbi:hypothetical protein GCM10010496_73050 [Streptomyces asoensis]|nr:hypothetical protein GCM10010496_73050 [Streptomyces asoensis]